MICKKCGSNVELPAKFCVYCGTLLDEEKIVQAPVNQTTVLNPVNQPVQPNIVNTPVENPTTLNSVEPTVEQPVNQTTVLNPVNQPVQPNVVNTPVENPTTLNSVEPTVEQPVNQTTVLNAVNQPVQPTVTQPVDPNLVNAQVDNSSTLSNNVLQQKKKKSKAWIFVVLAILLVGVAATIYFLVFNKQNSIQVLQKSLYNMVKKGENSATLNVNLLLEAEDKIDEALQLSKE